MRSSPTRTIAGVVNTDGTIKSGSGFASRRPSAGNYIVTFPAGFRLSAFTATALSGNPGLGAYGYTDTTVNIAVAGVADSGFSFVATGMGA